MDVDSVVCRLSNVECTAEVDDARSADDFDAVRGGIVDRGRIDRNDAALQRHAVVNQNTLATDIGDLGPRQIDETSQVRVLNPQCTSARIVDQPLR